MARPYGLMFARIAVSDNNSNAIVSYLRERLLVMLVESSRCLPRQGLHEEHAKGSRSMLVCVWTLPHAIGGDFPYNS
jgi:hypothetical protein